MDVQNIIAKLHPLERKIIPYLREETESQALIKASGMQEIEVMRALQWLENKEILKIKTASTEQVYLDKNGEKYQYSGLPEKRFLQACNSQFQRLSQIAQRAQLNTEELQVSLGLLKRQAAIDVRKGEELEVKLTPLGENFRAQKSPEEQLLQQLPKPIYRIPAELRPALEELRKRRDMIRMQELKTITITITPLGKKVLSQEITADVVNRLTPGMLKTGEWKKKQFRAYDVEINVPKIYPGRKHFENEAIEYIKQIWLDMGFQEMSGNYVQSAFWDLDALFVPQDHPAREMQDTFYLEGKAKLPKIAERVKEVHESGADTGSSGWKYQFSKEESAQVLLRTHTTVLSAQTLAQLKREDLPAKFFAIGKVFRNETLDWKHLFEFYQVDGIVVDPHANLKHLKGYLTQFYKKMGYEKVRMRPGYFPYVEPGLEVDVFHPVKKEWVELGGAGIFRPEVTKTLLGFECPVLAWGQGMARIISEYWKITDIRDLYRNDLKQIREMKVWLK